MAIYPASEVLYERTSPPSLATGFTVEPDPSLPSITPSPPNLVHQDSSITSTDPIITFLHLFCQFLMQPFPVQHCYLPNYLQQQAELIWMPSFPNSNNASMQCPQIQVQR